MDRRWARRPPEGSHARSRGFFDDDRDEGYHSVERYGDPTYGGAFEDRAYGMTVDERFGAGYRDHVPDRPPSWSAREAYGPMMSEGPEYRVAGAEHPGGYAGRRGGRGYGYEPGAPAYAHHELEPVGGHRGKGPRGYQRTDARLHELVCETLTEDDQVDATDIEVSVRGGDVVLAGHVPARSMKRRAEDCIEQISGIKDVQNQLKVSE